MRASLLIFLLLCATPAAWAGPPPAEVAAELDARGRAAYQARRYDEAAALFRSAWDMFRHPTYLWDLARCLHRGGQAKEAEARYRELVALPEARPELRVKAAAAIAELERARATPVVSPPIAQVVAGASGSSARVWGWVAIGLGTALSATSLGLALDAERRRDDVRAAQRNAIAGEVLTMSESEARERESTADTESTAALATIAAGGACLVTGLVLVLVAPDAQVTLGAETRGDGLVLHAGGRF